MVQWSVLSISIAKGVLVALNLLFMSIAVTLFSSATVELKILADYGEEEVKGSTSAYVVIMVVCIFLIMLSLFGCVGTVRGNMKILYTYIMFLAACMVLEVIVAIFVSVQRFGLQYRVMEWLREDFYSNVTVEDRADHDKWWDKLQRDYECCGLTGPEDYAAIARPISFSCCHRIHLSRTDIVKENMYRTCIESAYYYKFGCEEEILLKIKSTDDWFFDITVSSLWLEAAGLLLAIFVTNRIKNSVHVYKHTVKY